MRKVTYMGRPMKIYKRYSNFICFVDEKTNIKCCYNYYDLGLKKTRQKIDRLHSPIFNYAGKHEREGRCYLYE